MLSSLYSKSNFTIFIKFRIDALAKYDDFQSEIWKCSNCVNTANVYMISSSATGLDIDILGANRVVIMDAGETVWDLSRALA